MDIKKAKEDLQKTIDGLLICKDNKDCKKCPHMKKGCLLFIRSALAVALQFIMAGMSTEGEKDIEKIYI